MPVKNLHVRQAAVSALRAWAKGHDYAESLVERHAHRRMLSSADRNLLQAILFGVLRNRRLLDHWIEELRKGQLDPDTRDILRVGLCQILLLGIPDHAAVNETVEVGKAAVRGLINAVLRRAIVQREQLTADVSELPPAVALSHPDWLYKRWRQAFGKEEAIRLMEWNNQPAGVFFRVNPLVGATGDMPGEACAGMEGFYRLEGAFPSRLVNDGAIYIQDPATRHAVELLGPAAGDRILDACAAPGGKAFLSAVAMGGGSGLVCTDSNEKRLPRLEENLQRLHVSGVDVRVHDWNQPAPADWIGQFDGVLLDVPCSNTGVIRRRVDVRWRIQPQDIERLVVTQRRILDNAAKCVAAGGRLVYSTCSIDADENIGVVKGFLTDHPEWKLVGERVVLPFLDGTDGAYAARIEKTA
jgi:16S rRNA (cytosine967-C5)-methyltransferase